MATGGKHRLRTGWWNPSTHTVFVTLDGDVLNAATGPVGSTGKAVEVGSEWLEGDE